MVPASSAILSRWCFMGKTPVFYFAGDWAGDWVGDGIEGGSGSPTASRMRSEEHTSELQSLMRISYAVFCLKNKNIKEQHKNISQIKSNTHTIMKRYI